MWTFLFQTKNPFFCLDDSVLKVRKCIREDKVLGCHWGDQRFPSSQTCHGFAGRSQVNFLLSLHHHVTRRTKDGCICRGKKVTAIKQKNRAITQVMSLLAWNSWCLMSILCMFQALFYFQKLFFWSHSLNAQLQLEHVRCIPLATHLSFGFTTARKPAYALQGCSMMQTKQQ